VDEPRCNVSAKPAGHKHEGVGLIHYEASHDHDDNENQESGVHSALTGIVLAIVGMFIGHEQVIFN